MVAKVYVGCASEQGPSYNVYVICVVSLTKSRRRPNSTTYKIPKNDCAVLMGGFNEELSNKIKRHTGSHTMSSKGSKNVDKIIDLMGLYDLNTKFHKCKKLPGTYLQVPGCETLLVEGRRVRVR